MSKSKKQYKEIKVNESLTELVPIRYCGIDYHKNTCAICIVDERGKILTEEEIPSTGLGEYFANESFLIIGIEISGGVFHETNKLEGLGHEVKIIDAVKFRGIGMGGKKNDRKDAHAIAMAIRSGWVPEVYKKSIYSRRLNSLLRSRDILVQTRVSITNHVRGIMYDYGIKMEQGAGVFWTEVFGALNQLDCEFLKRVLQSLAEEAGRLKDKEDEIERELQSYAQNDPRVTMLQSVPGVGLLTALAFIAVIDDAKRFTHSKKIGSYLGLVPRENSSGGRRYLGRITKAGNDLLRRYLIQGCQTVMQYEVKETSDRARKWANDVEGRTGKKKAVVALAHKRARIMYAMLRDNVTYNRTGFGAKKAA